MRSRVPLYALLFVLGSLALPHLAHAAIPFFGPIIPPENPTCPLGWGAVISVINNIISLLLTLAIVFVAPLMIAYSGFLFVVNPVNAGGKEQAKKILTNTIVGIVIALAGWMIVDAIMVALYNPDTPIPGGRLGAWSDLITSDGVACLKQEGSPSGSSATKGVVPTLDVAPSSETAPAAPMTAPQGTAQQSFNLDIFGAPTISSTERKKLASQASKYKSDVCAAAEKQGIPDQCNQLLAMMAVESAFKPGETSNKGAIGLLQLIPTTAASNGVSVCKGSTNDNPSTGCVRALQDPATNINAGVKYYSVLLNKFGGDANNATAAYNAGDSGRDLTGEGGKRQAFAPSVDCKDQGWLAWQCPKNPGGLKETQNYVVNVNAIKSILSS